MSELRGLLASLTEDVIAAREALSGSDTPVNRRNLVRTTLIAVEGLVWEARKEVRQIAEDMDELTPLADLALQERSYQVTARGEVVEAIKYISLPTSIRLVVRQAELLSHDVKIDFADDGWGKLLKAIEIRNRLTHPKSLSDLGLSDAEINIVNESFEWVLGEFSGLLASVVGAFRNYSEKIKELTDALLRGDPQALQIYNAVLRELE